MTRPAFESSLSALRDNVVMAIERREMGVVQDGLDVYLRLVEVTLDEQLSLQGRTAGLSASNVPLGHEWERLLRDLHGVIDRVCASASLLLWVDVLSWVRTVASACIDRGVVNALSTILTLFESAWSQELVSSNKDSAARQDALLLRLSEFGRFYLNRGQLGREADRGVLIAYTKAFVRVIKQAIESGDLEASRVAVEYFLFGSTSTSRTRDPVTGSGLLALYAWILYRFDHGKEDDSFKQVCAQIAGAFDQHESFVPLLQASDDLERELGIHWWELRDRGPMSSGVIQIGSYMSLALMLIAGPRLLSRGLDPADEESVDSARRFMTIIDSIEKGSFARALAALNVPSDQFELLKSTLSSVVEQGDALLEESYARLPVDPERIERFRTAIRAKLSEVRTESLAAALAASSTESAESVEPNFGLDSIVPRWYFASTEVFADPEQLAESLVRGLINGEEDRILDIALVDLGAASKTTLDSVVAQLREVIAGGSWVAPVVVTNSYQAHQALKGSPDKTADASSEHVPKANFVRVHDERPPYVALLSPAGMPAVQLIAPAAEVAGDEVESDLAVIVGVSELSSEEIDEIVGREDRSRVDEARIRGSVRIRLLEHLEVRIAKESIPLLWSLPEDTW